MAADIWAEHYTPIIGAGQVAYMLDKFQSESAIRQHITEGYHYSAAFTKDGAVAYCATRCDFGDRRVFLSKLYTARSCRGQGAASALLAYHVKKYPEAASVWLTVNKQNAGSIAAYLRMGFYIKEEAVGDIGEGYVMDDYIMEKPLQS